MNIQWYPGHMTKTRRMMADAVKQVDAVCEVLDARIPLSSRNPDIDSMAGTLPRLIVLNRGDQADPDITARWKQWFIRKGCAVIVTDCKSGTGTRAFDGAVKALLKEKRDRWLEKGQTGRKLKVMIVGIPNVGKSSLINRLSGRKATKTEDRPGVTRDKQWVTVSEDVILLDTPGILWPKIDDPDAGVKLACTGAVRDQVVDTEELACRLLELLHQVAPQTVTARFKVTTTGDGNADLEACARKRGFLVGGGEVDTERMALTLLDEYRGGKLGRITLERPETAEA